MKKKSIKKYIRTVLKKEIKTAFTEILGESGSEPKGLSENDYSREIEDFDLHEILQELLSEKNENRLVKNETKIVSSSNQNNNFILLAHWNGRFGNRLHQYAYGATYSKLNNVPFYLPSDWEGTKLFSTQYHEVIQNENIRHHINQTLPELDTIEYRSSVLKEHYPTITRVIPEFYIKNYEPPTTPVYFDSVCAYSPHIFEKMSKEYLLKVFEFSDEVKNTNAYRFWEERQGTYDVAHLRRDDIADPQYNKFNHQGYSVLSMDSYLNAFDKYGYNPDEIIWISDDKINKWHTNRPKVLEFGWNYPVGSVYREGYVFDWLEDFLTMYFARTIFRANSSFSWWAAFLSPTAKVYSPVINKQHIYGVDGTEEIFLDFVEGNHPHWMYKNCDIRIN